MHWSIASCRGESASRRHYPRVFNGLLLLSLLLSMSCTPSNTTINSSSPTNSPVVKKDNYIKATPNPVPAGPGNGTTIIAWRTAGLTAVDVHVFVVAADGNELLFATAPEGSKDAPWISADAPFEFRLYYGSGADKKLLDKVIVTRNK